MARLFWRARAFAWMSVMADYRGSRAAWRWALAGICEECRRPFGDYPGEFAGMTPRAAVRAFAA